MSNKMALQMLNFANMQTSQKTITAFKIIRFWLITLLISTILHFIFRSLNHYGIFLIYLKMLAKVFITNVVIYSPILIALLIVYAISSNKPLRIKSKRLVTTFILSFAIIYACACCWNYFNAYSLKNPLIPDHIYQKLFIDLVMKYSVAAFIYAGTTTLAWIFMSRRMRKWNAYLPDQNEHLLDQ